MSAVKQLKLTTFHCENVSFVSFVHFPLSLGSEKHHLVPSDGMVGYSLMKLWLKLSADPGFFVQLPKSNLLMYMLLSTEQTVWTIVNLHLANHLLSDH